MSLSLTVIFLFLAIRYAKWSKWRDYYPTLLYMAMLNLLYLFIIQTDYLWKFKSSILPHGTLAIMLIYILQGSMTLLFLSYHPIRWRPMLLYWSFWVILFSLIEYIFYLADRIDYFRGWNIGWSIFFYIIMYPMLYLHYKKPLAALVLSIPITLGFMWIFGYF